MDGLSAVASGVAVVQVTFQLVESFKKLCEFWKSIKEAPEEIRAISADLELLSSVLIQVAHETQHAEPDATLIAALNGCCVKVKTLTTILNEIEPGFASKSLRIRKWTAFKAVLKHGELKKFQEALERLKGTLLLVQQNQSSRLSRNRQQSLEWSLATIIHNISRLSVQQHLEIAERIPNEASDTLPTEDRDAFGLLAGNAYLVQGDYSNTRGSWSVPQKTTMVKRTLRETKSVIEGFLGTIWATSTTNVRTSRQMGDLAPYPEQDQYEYKTSYAIHPAPWLIRLGVHYGIHLGFLSSSTQGWKNSLKTFCPVPDDALIFEFCRQGNVPGVRSLLSGGHASVRDTNARGYTPLHVAAENFHPELCEILKSAGADINTPTHDAWTPIRLAAAVANYCTHAKLSETFDTFRILIDSMDFFEADGDGWEVLEHLCESACELHGCPDAKCSLLLWMLRLSSFELKTNIIEERYADMLDWVLGKQPELAEASDLLLDLGGRGIINTVPRHSTGYTILHKRIVLVYSESDLSVVVARGPNLHGLVFDTSKTPFEESPTSLAMYSSLAFTYWLRALIDNGVDLETFIDQELQQNLEVHPGWEKETLLDLFKYGDRPDLHVRKALFCSDCDKSLDPVGVQPYWRHLLTGIRERRNPGHPALANSELDNQENAGLGGVGEAVRSSSDPIQKPDSTDNVPRANLDEIPFEPESEDRVTPIQSDYIYDWQEMVCMDCWLHYESSGHRFAQDLSTNEDLSENEDSPSSDESSECEYSPFLIHS